MWLSRCFFILRFLSLMPLSSSSSASCISCVGVSPVLSVYRCIMYLYLFLVDGFRFLFRNSWKIGSSEGIY